jgi:hypothetical protein
MERLAKRSCLPPTTLFTVKMPEAEKNLRAANEICEEFGQIGVRTLPFEQAATLRKLLETRKAA